MVLLITGDRNWKDVKRIDHIMRLVAEKTQQSPLNYVLHGAAAGADSIAGETAKKWELNVHAEPAKWDKYGKAAGPIRNARMLDIALTYSVWPVGQKLAPDPRNTGSIICLAFHNNLTQSKGTKDMVTRVLRAKVPVFLVEWSRYVVFTPSIGTNASRQATASDGTLLFLLESCGTQQNLL